MNVFKILFEKIYRIVLSMYLCNECLKFIAPSVLPNWVNNVWRITNRSARYRITILYILNERFGDLRNSYLSSLTVFGLTAKKIHQIYKIAKANTFLNFCVFYMNLSMYTILYVCTIWYRWWIIAGIQSVFITKMNNSAINKKNNQRRIDHASQ